MANIVVSEEDLGGKILTVREDEALKPSVSVSEKEIDPELTDGTNEALQELQELKQQKEEPIIEFTTWQTPRQFIKYLENKIKNPPQFPKNSIRGIERQIIFYENLSKEISKAISQDAMENTLTAQDLLKLDELDKYINNQIQGLESRMKKLQKGIFLSSLDTDLKKEAYTPIVQFYVDPFLDAIVRKAINAKISSGKNIEEIFEHLAKSYNLNDRERLAALNLFNAYGYPLRTNIYEDDELITNYHA